MQTRPTITPGKDEGNELLTQTDKIHPHIPQINITVPKINIVFIPISTLITDINLHEIGH